MSWLLNLLAPIPSQADRLLSFLERGQGANALSVLLENEGGVPLGRVPERAILMAAERGFSDVVDALINCGADKEEVDLATGRTPLLIGSAGGHILVVDILLQRGANSKARDAKGMDLIALASSRELQEVLMKWVDDETRLPSPVEITVEISPPNGTKNGADSRPEAISETKIPSISTPNLSYRKAVLSTPAPAPREPLVSALWSPVRGLRLTGSKKESDPLQSPVAKPTIRAAMDTAEAMQLPNEQWKKVKDVFTNVECIRSEKNIRSEMERKSSEKNENDLIAKIRADPSLLSAGRASRMWPKVENGATLLHFAAGLGNTRAVSVLLGMPDRVETEVDVSIPTAADMAWAVDLCGRVALHTAAEEGHPEVCKLLLDAMLKGKYDEDRNGESKWMTNCLGRGAPMDLSGFTPVALTAREQACQEEKGDRFKREDRDRYDAVRRLLFRPGDPSILPYVDGVDVSERCGRGSLGSPAFGFSEAPGWRVIMEDSRLAFSPIPSGAATSTSCYGTDEGENGGAVLHGFNVDGSSSGSDAPIGCGLFGIFDGHGGAFAGRYTAANFQPVFSATDGWKKYCTASVGGGGGDGDAFLLAQALTDAMCRVDYALGELPQMKWEKLKGNKWKEAQDVSGTTAIVGLVTPEQVLVANLGDCRAILISAASSTNDGDEAVWTSLALSEMHKPDNPKERARIEAADEIVESGRVGKELAVSRAIGDFKFKHADGKASDEQPVSNYPDIVVHERTENDVLLFLACDGIWDVLSDADVTRFLTRFLHAQLTEESSHVIRPEYLAGACDALIALCLERNSTDNMTALAVHLGGGSRRSS